MIRLRFTRADERVAMPATRTAASRAYANSAETGFTSMLSKHVAKRFSARAWCRADPCTIDCAIELINASPMGLLGMQNPCRALMSLLARTGAA
jgi:hypothetical protein